MKNKIVDLRNHLFATLEALQDEEKPMDLERAKTIAIVADRVVATAKVEVDYLNVVGGKGSGFIPDTQPALPTPEQRSLPRVVRPINR